MFSLETLRKLYVHMAWADARVWDAIPEPGGSTPDDRLRMLLLHIHTVQRAFLGVWTRQSIVFRHPSEFPTMAALRDWAQPYYPEADAFIRSLETDRLLEPITLPWVRQFEQRLGQALQVPTLGDTIFQVTSHSTHHRAQVNTRLTELGVDPPLVDYIAWVWFGKPDRREEHG